MGSSLWKDGGFKRYYFFNLLSYFGSGLSMVALPFYIYEQTSSPIYTALAAASTSLPYLLFGLFAGALADSGNRKRIMIASDLFCAAVLASVPAAAVIVGYASPWHLIAVSFLTAAAFVGFDSASHGALLQLVGRQKLPAANSLLISSDTVVRIGSPVIAGGIIAAFGAEWAIAVTAVCYLLSALLIWSIRQSFQPPRTPIAAELRPKLLQKLHADIREGLSYIWSEPLIRSLTLLGFGNSFVGGAAVGLIVVYGARVLGFADDAPQLGMLLTCGSLGALLASLSLPKLRNRFMPGRITIAGLAISGASLFGFALSGEMIAASLFYLLWNAGSTLIIVNGITLRQQLTPDHLQGRVHASSRMIAYGGSPFGSLSGGMAAAWIGVQPSYSFMALLMIVLSAIAIRTPLQTYIMKKD
ncbi:MFS transporter [Paenibacillus harenae]|uniref:MFS transporter n=1 Tax=Paenibacillus harenae TaxID=306543 RepID=UPI000425FD76|nr:MFS transporter [Paenibacillus harenae]